MNTMKQIKAKRVTLEAERQARRPRPSKPIYSKVITRWKHWCIECGDGFESKRGDVLFCSKDCCHLAFRKRRRAG